MASIYKRGNVWYLSYRAGGKRVRKSVGKSKKIAILAQKEVEVGLAKKKLGWEEIRDPTFYDFQEKYLQYLKANTRPTTYVRYRKALQHFTDFLTSYGTASAKLSQISFQLIEEYKQERSKAVKPLTVNVELKVLKALYNFALKCKCARENPVSEVSTQYIGQLIQHDSSHHKFSPYADERWCLITSLDDYSRLLLYARMVERELSWHHIVALEYVFLTYGIPFRYYVDSHSIFRFVQGRDSMWRKHYLITDEVDT